MRNAMLLLTLWAFTLAATPGPAVAMIDTDSGEVHFDDVILRDRTALKRTGTAVLRYLRIFKVYTAAFYLESGASVEEVLEDRAKRFEVSYLRPFEAEDFGEATYKALRNAVSPAEIERLRPRIDYHNSLYESVQPGDRYALTYIPGKGTELARNGEVVGVIEGADFAVALFSIWVGQRPIDRQFRQELLGLR